MTTVEIILLVGFAPMFLATVGFIISWFFD